MQIDAPSQKNCNTPEYINGFLNRNSDALIVGQLDIVILISVDLATREAHKVAGRLL